MIKVIYMEGISATVYKGLKEYWGRRGYQRLNGSGQRTRVELGATRNRKGRLWRWKIKITPKIRIQRIPSPKKLLVWLRDAYVRMMLGLANSRVMTMSASASGFGGTLPGGDPVVVFGRGPPKEYDEKVIIQIYKSLIMGHGHLVPRDAARIASEIA